MQAWQKKKKLLAERAFASELNKGYSEETLWRFRFNI